MPTPTHHPASLEYIVELWRNGASIGSIAEECGVSRQRISQRLIEAGYSPALRRAERIATREGATQHYKQLRAENLARRAEAREEAIQHLLDLAREHGVSVATLGQYATHSGAYAKGTSREHPQSFRYGTGKLPPRDEPEGLAIAEQARAAAAPWSAMHLARIASRR